MFSAVLFCVMIAVTCLFVVMFKKSKKTDEKNACIVFSILFALATVIVILSLTFGKYSCQIYDFAEVRGLKMRITLLEERRENLTSIIKNELQKYPEIEREIISKLGPAPSFLFNYPQLQSNKTITKTVDDVIKVQDEVYNKRGLLIESLQKIYLREISPWTIYVKSYEKFFGEKNPILTENPVH